MKAPFLLFTLCFSAFSLPLKAAPATLQQRFVHPPADARPMMRWWWFGIATDKAEIRRELEQMKADGLGGAELAFVYPQVLNHPPLINQPFLSAPMLESVRYAASEARRLGLRLDVTLGSGWPYGGPATTLRQAATCLRIAEALVPPGATSAPEIALAKGESVISVSLAGETLPQGRVEGFAPSPIPRTATVFIASHTGQQVKRAAVGAEGWVLDPFSRDAVATHLHAVGDPLLKTLAGTPPYAVFSDSLEAYGADWTPGLPAEFARRRGYDLLPHLSEIATGGTAASNCYHLYIYLYTNIP